jgi:hypothetical protein
MAHVSHGSSSEVDLRNREVRFAATHNELKLDTTPRPVSAMCGRLRVGKDFLHVRGASTAGRAELQTVLDFLRKGDCLMVTRIDRLARSIGDLQDIVRSVKAKGATLKATEQPFDTGNIYGELTVNLLGCFAEFETNLRKERQAEGIAKAKAAGVYKGAATVNRLRQGPGVEAEGLRRVGDCKGSQNWTGVGLSCP